MMSSLYLEITDSIFTSNDDVNIYSDQTVVNITNSHFTDNHAEYRRYISVANTKFYLSGSTF